MLNSKLKYDRTFTDATIVDKDLVPRRCPVCLCSRLGLDGANPALPPMTKAVPPRMIASAPRDAYTSLALMLSLGFSTKDASTRETGQLPPVGQLNELLLRERSQRSREISTGSVPPRAWYGNLNFVQSQGTKIRPPRELHSDCFSVLFTTALKQPNRIGRYEGVCRGCSLRGACDCVLVCLRFRRPSLSCSSISGHKNIPLRRLLKPCCGGEEVLPHEDCKNHKNAMYVVVGQ